MSDYTARRVRFDNGERTSILLRAETGQPVHESVLFLHAQRVQGKAANTIHIAAANLAFLHRELDRLSISLEERLSQGKVLSAPEVLRLVDKARYRVSDFYDEQVQDGPARNIVSIERLRMRRQGRPTLKPVDPGPHASRLRTFVNYFEFRANYADANTNVGLVKQLRSEIKQLADVLRAHIPNIPRRAKLGARIGLSMEEQNRLLGVVQIDSPANPWKRPYVRVRNWLIIVVLLASGMRSGELLGLQIGDLNATLPKLQIKRRADAASDPRRVQPNTKTYDREIELNPSIIKKIWEYINGERRAIKEARRYPQIFVADDGQPLSLKSIEKMFAQFRKACPGLPLVLTSHVMRHSWNERFSEEAEAMNMSEQREERARSEQMGWSDRSKMAQTYTRRYTQRKGRAVRLRIQNQLQEKLNGSN